jgi:hypothetical protein
MGPLDELIGMGRNDPMRKMAAKSAAAGMRRDNMQGLDMQKQEMPRGIVDKMASVAPRNVQPDLSKFRTDLYGEIDPDELVYNHPKHGEIRRGDVFHASKRSGMHPVSLIAKLFD